MSRRDTSKPKRRQDPTGQRVARNVHAASSQPGRTRSRMIVRTSRAGSRRTGRRH